MNRIQAVILAAGKSSRFNTGKSKLLETICGQEMILYPLEIFKQLTIPSTLIVGYQKEEIIKLTSARYGAAINFVTQEEQRGSGHAIMCSSGAWQEDHILIMNGDAPLVTRQIVEKLIEKHLASGAAMTFVTSHNVDPTLGGYGRVLEENNVLKIVEAADFKGDITVDYPINAGIYLLKRSFLEEFITKIPQSPVKNEYYFTEIVRLGSEAGYKIITHEVPFDHVRGVNTLRELWIAELLKRSELINYWMDRGVRFDAAQNVQLDITVELAPGCRIGSGVHLRGNTRVGEHTDIQPFSIVRDSHIGSYVTIQAHTVIEQSTLANNVTVGPFTHLQDYHHTADGAYIPSFCKLTKIVEASDHSNANQTIASTFCGKNPASSYEL